VEKHEGKVQLGRPRHTLENNIKNDLIEIRGECADWIDLA
jgi:hypothetical protein